MALSKTTALWNHKSSVAEWLGNIYVGYQSDKNLAMMQTVCDSSLNV
jgi:hypothetical protein